MKVLLLVDLQNDFCPGGALAVPDGNETIPVANSLIKSGDFDLIVASQDWHPANHISFAQNHSGKQPFESIEVTNAAQEKDQQTLWPVHCIEHSKGAALHPELDTAAIDLFVPKGTAVSIDSYSAFFDNGRSQETGLRKALQEHAAARGETLRDVELFVCGLALDYCVAATARDARFLNIDTTLVVDGCRAVNIHPGDDLKALRELQNLGVTIIESREFCRDEVPLSRIKNPTPEIHP